MARSMTADALERYEGQAAFGEAINLLGCALPHPSNYHFQGHLGQHTLSTAVRFAVHCRRWLELKSNSVNPNLCCALEFDGDFAYAKYAHNLRDALNQIIHSDGAFISKVQAKLKFESKGATELQRRFYLYENKYHVVILKIKTDKYEEIIVPLIVLLDAYFPLMCN